MERAQRGPAAKEGVSPSAVAASESAKVGPSVMHSQTGTTWCICLAIVGAAARD